MRPEGLPYSTESGNSIKDVRFKATSVTICGIASLNYAHTFGSMYCKDACGKVGSCVLLYGDGGWVECVLCEKFCWYCMIRPELTTVRRGYRTSSRCRLWKGSNDVVQSCFRDESWCG
jgi:hypothetical protein